MTNEYLYNSRILDVYCKLINARYPEVDLQKLTQDCGIKLSQVNDEGHWFTQEQVNTFYNSAVSMTGNQRIAREAGRFAASANSLGVMRQYILSSFGPRRMFQIIGKLASKLTRSSRYSSTIISHNSVELVVKPYDGIKEEPFQCENRMGFFEAGVMMFNYNLPGIKHTECIFRGDNACRYEISWERPLSSRWRKIRNQCSWGALSLFTAVLIYEPLMAFSIVFPASLAVLVVLNFLADNSEKAELRDSLIQTSDVTEKLVDQMCINYNNASAIKDIGTVLRSDSTKESILKNVTDILQSRLDFERCAILLANEERSHLTLCEEYGYSKEELNVLSGVKFNLDNPESQGVLVRCFRENNPILINKLEEHFPEMSERSRTIAYKLNVKSLVCCPICIDSKPIGVIMMDNPHSGRPLVQTDLTLIEGIAPSVGASLHNLSLLEEREALVEKLQKKAAEQERYIYTFSHDMKTPLVTISGFCGLAKVDFASGNQVQGNKNLDVVSNAANRMRQLLDELLHLSRVGFHVNPNENINLKTLIEEAIENIAGIVTENKTTIEVESVLPDVFVDKQYILQVFENLITNASRYSRSATSGSHVKIGVTHNSQELICYVEDNGIGIESRHLEKVFNLFEKLDTETNGTGVGLAIAKRIIENHGGRIWAESEGLGHGATFSFTLPEAKQ